MPHSVLSELGDQQRLRMLTARVGTASDLVSSPGPPCACQIRRGRSTDLRAQAHLDQLLSPGDRQVGAPPCPRRRQSARYRYPVDGSPQGER